MIVYHATRKENLIKILTKGLKKGYVDKNKKDVFNFGVSLSSDFIILKINIPKKLFFEYVDNYIFINEGYDSIIKTIPPNFLTINKEI